MCGIQDKPGLRAGSGSGAKTAFQCNYVSLLACHLSTGPLFSCMGFLPIGASFHDSNSGHVSLVSGQRTEDRDTFPCHL